MTSQIQDHFLYTFVIVIIGHFTYILYLAHYSALLYMSLYDYTDIKNNINVIFLGHPTTQMNVTSFSNTSNLTLCVALSLGHNTKEMDWIKKEI